MNTNSVLIHNCLNEVLHGLGHSRDVVRILQRKREIEQLFETWQLGARSDLLVSNAALIADVIDVVCAELGEDEFEIRTGVDLHEAKTFVKELQTNENRR